MFAAGFVFERVPMQWASFPDALMGWVQGAGGVAAFCLILYVIVGLATRREGQNRGLEVASVLAVVLAYGVYLAVARFDRSPTSRLPGIFLTIAGGVALTIVAVPFLWALATRISPGRIWAIARLSLKEAVRRRVVAVFAIMALIFLFADWFVPYKQEDQVRNYVRVVYWSMTPLFLLTASLLGAFSIPNDVKSQSIHTVVTKPVERLEIVLGRFFGYAVVITAGLALVALLSLVYIGRGVTPEAEAESFKARVPIYGSLGFYNTAGESVGREWDYRKYISGSSPSQPNKPKQYAFWIFENLPVYLGTRQEAIPFELTFDIFRLTKGDEGKGVICTFTFADARLEMRDIEAMLEKVRQERDKMQAKIAKEAQDKRSRREPPDIVEKWAAAERERIQDELLSTYPVYEVGAVEVTDYHTRQVLVPPALFKKLTDVYRENPDEAGKTDPKVRVLVNIAPDPRGANSAQMVGMAAADLYILADEKPFWQNFFKGFVGMWFSFMLVLGVAVAISTYLSGVISWLATLFLYLAGTVNFYIRELAEGRSLGGGPIESIRRIATKTPLTMPAENTPAANLVQNVDDVYRWGLSLFLNILPDVNRFDLHQYVANGFNISFGEVLFLDNFVYLVGYLLPWLILAFYLLRGREIANPT